MNSFLSDSSWCSGASDDLGDSDRDSLPLIPRASSMEVRPSLRRLPGSFEVKVALQIHIHVDVQNLTVATHGPELA